MWSLFLLAACYAAIPNMNGDYLIANPDKTAKNPYEVILDKGYNRMFEVTSPKISTLYSQVYWTMMDPVPLPKEIVEEFNGKGMAITGFE